MYVVGAANIYYLYVCHVASWRIKIMIWTVKIILIKTIAGSLSFAKFIAQSGKISLDL